MNVNFQKRRLHLKIVLCGRSHAGKTTALEAYHASVPPSLRGELTAIQTEGDRTLFADFELPGVRLGHVAVHYQLYTVPGSVYYQATKRLALQGADGIVFFVDPQPEAQDENEEELARTEEHLHRNLEGTRHEPGAVERLLAEHLVFLWSKRDLPSALPVAELRRRLAREDTPGVEGSFGSGIQAAVEELLHRGLRRFLRQVEEIEGPTTVAGHALGFVFPGALSDTYLAYSPAAPRSWNRTAIVARSEARKGVHAVYARGAEGAQPHTPDADELAALLRSLPPLLACGGPLPTLIAEGEREGRPALLIEEGGGWTLAERFARKERWLPEPEVWTRLLEALVALREAGLEYHGDLAPHAVSLGLAGELELRLPAPRTERLFVARPASDPLRWGDARSDVLAVLAMIHQRYRGSSPFADAPEGADRATLLACVQRLDPLRQAPAPLQTFVGEGLRELLESEGGGDFATPRKALARLRAAEREHRLPPPPPPPPRETSTQDTPPPQPPGLWSRISGWFS